MLKNTIWLTLALAFRSLGQAGLLIVFARFGSADLLGEYTLALAITAPVFVFCEFGLRTVYLTHRGSQSFSTYLKVRMATLTLATLLTLAIGTLFSPGMTAILLLVSLLRVADSFGELYSAPLQRHGSLATILIAFGINAAMTIGLGLLVLIITGNLLLVIATLTLVSSATTLFLMKVPTDRLLRSKEVKRETPEWKSEYLPVITAGLPTGISWGLLSLLSSIPQYFLAAYFSQIEVGYFAVILYVVVVVEIFMNAVSQSWIPAAKNLFLEPASFFRKVMRTAGVWTAGFIPVSAVVCAAAYIMLPIVFGERFSIHWPEVIPLYGSLLILPLVFFSAMALNVANNYFVALSTSILAAAISAGVALLTIPGTGVPGALWVCFASLASRAVLSLAALALTTRRRIPV
ncbi:lipopolysaccharide biosynthesis protein [Pseudarthrobacter sp. BIM B-2242]|uniref:lipopolysaccharide biosynthesis protein n=1 Tax=Pseudarthrobacter sp. BIM B-2242 TaxID=2772401 RepID=UPI00168AA204|nr:hypothetical protein [Pseudarthrobacter sp. BIM B-2242]QOD02193.1 hypothetical protein IDT60_12510 [Pseudarthrobacter sp. BIM B-2242]